jgi:hypothetical protein
VTMYGGVQMFARRINSPARPLTASIITKISLPPNPLQHA